MGGDQIFLSYHIIRHKCLVFNKKKIKEHTKPQKSMAQSKEKESRETDLEKDQMVHLLDKDFKTTV